MTVRVREGGRTVLVHALIATGVNADGKREILGLDVTSSEDGSGWLAFFRGLVAPRQPHLDEFAELGLHPAIGDFPVGGIVRHPGRTRAARVVR